MNVSFITNERIERLYGEYLTFVDDLKTKTREERIELYVSMTKTLLPHAKKMVDLEDQLNEERRDYQRKFKEWFFVICNWTFSNAHFGETCFEKYKKDVVKKSKNDKQSSKIYAHKVILALGLMGYLKKVKENYSHSKIRGHGYNYEVDLFKWAELGKGVTRGNVSVSLDVDVDWSGYEGRCRAVLQSLGRLCLGDRTGRKLFDREEGRRTPEMVLRTCFLRTACGNRRRQGVVCGR